ncbi:hypothetical protein Tco_0463089 [Tanacetum coccineum]
MVPPNNLGPDLNGKVVNETRDHILKGDIELHFIPTQYQLADIFNKPLDEPTFKRLIVELACLSEATEQSHMSHSWICMSMCGFVAFTGALIHSSRTHTLIPKNKSNHSNPNNDMANQEQIPPQQDQPERPESPIPFAPAKQVGFNLEDIIFNPNNERKEPAYRGGDITTNPTQIFSANNLALKLNQPEGPPFTDHMLAICSADEPVFGLGYKPKPASSFYTYKEDQQATGDPKSLGVTSEERANPQLSSGMLAFNLNKLIFSASFILHSEFASGRDASADSTTEADPGISTPSTDPNVLVDLTQSINEGLDTVLTESKTGKGAITIAKQIEEASSDKA